MNKYKDVMFTTDFEKLKGIKRRPLYRKHEVLSNENEDFGVYEIISKQAKIKDNKPHQLGLAILQWSKLLFLR